VARHIAASDVNHDGKVDLAVSGQDSVTLDDWVFVLLGDGNGGFPTVNPVNRGTAGSIGPLVLEDFNRDGDLDVAAVRGGQVETLLGNGTGSFGFFGGTAMPDAPDLEAGDVNRDGVPDVVSVDPGGDQIVVALGTGSGGLGTATTFAAGSTGLVAEISANGPWTS
jgi:hypothetical protein